MAAQLSLRISLEGGRVTKTIQFDPNTTVFDACRLIRDKFADAVQGQGKLEDLLTAGLILRGFIQQPPSMDSSSPTKITAKEYGWNRDETSVTTCFVTSTFSSIDEN